MELEKQFLQAYDEFSDAIFRHCYFRVFNREQAKELVQETFMKTWQYLKNNDKEAIKNIRAFLYRVANNLIIDHARKNKPVSLEEMMEGGFDTGEDGRDKLVSIADGKDMIKLLSQISPKYRQAVQMKFIDDLLPREIAEAIGETENNVSVRIHRGLEQIRELLKEDGKI